MECCAHTDVYDGVCNQCGLEVFGISNGTYIDMSSSYSEHHSYMDNNNLQPFEVDLRGMDLPMEVKSMAMNLASSCPRETHRMGVRRQQLFSYIYLAYLQLGLKFDPERLREEMGMTQREVNMALRIVSGTSSISIPLPTNDLDECISAPVVVISPVIYLEEICTLNGIPEHTERVTVMSKTILKKNKILFESNPRHIAISLVKYYLNCVGVNIPKFSKNNRISDSILKQHVTKIGEINV